HCRVLTRSGGNASCGWWLWPQPTRSETRAAAVAGVRGAADGWSRSGTRHGRGGRRRRLRGGGDGGGGQQPTAASLAPAARAPHRPPPTVAHSPEVRCRRSLFSSRRPCSPPSPTRPRPGAVEGAAPAPCDIFQGEWVPDESSPQYTNLTCSYIQEHQNCMMYGRPDLEFLKWRWKPAGCDLPRFDPDKFLRLVGNKTLAFVGDSLARNHMQSLLCLLCDARPATAGCDAEGRVGDGEDGPGQDTVLRGVQLHHTHLLVAIPGEDGGVGGEPRRVQAVPRRARLQVVRPRGAVRLRHLLGGQLVHAAVPVLREREARRRQLRGAQHHQRPDAAALPPDGVPDGAPGHQRHQVQGEGDRADAVADVALRGRRVGQGRRLPADAAVQGERDGHGRHGPGILHVAGGGVQGGAEGGGGERGGHGAHGPHRRDAAPAGRPPEPVRPLAGREAGAVQ
ncbi:hypothetical protein EE612_004719, partial [Oryza sativa]